MPIYAYECKECGVRFERRQSFSDEPVKICPECGGEVHRLIQPAGIIFKGSGFYVTDNRGSKSSLTTPTRSEGKEDRSGSKDGKGDAKKSDSATPSAPKNSKASDD
jgi:putative FmdB family regulatory protein